MTSTAAARDGGTIAQAAARGGGRDEGVFGRGGPTKLGVAFERAPGCVAGGEIRPASGVEHAPRGEGGVSVRVLLPVVRFCLSGPGDVSRRLQAATCRMCVRACGGGRTAAREMRARPGLGRIICFVRRKRTRAAGRPAERSRARRARGASGLNEMARRTKE